MKSSLAWFGSWLLLVSFSAAPAVRAADASLPEEFGGSSPLQWSVRMADAEMGRLGNSLEYQPDNHAKWDYTTGLFTLALLKLHQQVNNPRYVRFAEDTIGSFITPDGTIQRYKVEDFSLDNVNPGKTLLALWQLTHDARYQKAAGLLREQLDLQPRTRDGGFWHKKRYPNQMWLDGIYMAEPFYAEYAKLFHGPAVSFDDIARQIRLIGEHTYDPETGLFYHGWDAARKQPWANPVTGTSSNFWGRAIGWYAMALVDTLDYFPTDHPARPEIIALLQKVCAGVAKYQDPESGLWYQVVDQGSRPGNYLEATVSSMFVYAMAKGVDHGYLPHNYVPVLLKGYRGLVTKLVKTDGNGNVTLTHCCSVAGLGYGRDGSFAYYIREPVVDNDLKGIGPFILAGLEVQRLLNASPADAAETRPGKSKPADLTPASVLQVMQRVADWQLAHPSRHKATDWTQGAGAAGMMALAGISGDPKYREAMYAMGESNRWQLGPRKYMADDHCIGQTYAELYFLYRKPKMIQPMRQRFDWILAHPPATTSLDFSQPGHGQKHWSWCDSLFMGPPTWARLYAATGDPRYLNFVVTNWWRTTAYLYDTNEHLYFRDSTYFKQREANGQKVFWSRGNGWVMGGLVRVLQSLPMNHPDRPRFEALFKEMSEKILTCQQPDGLWRSSLLDPESYPLKETSGSGFFTYALAWGVNQGLLDRAKFEPAVRKAWKALVGCVDADGKLTHVQPIGADPKKFDPQSTEIYGVGAFLLAGSEVYHMEVLEQAPKRAIKAIKVTNPSAFRCDGETVELNRSLLPNAGWTEPPRWAVMDAESSRILDSQAYSETSQTLPDKFLFQVDLAPHETRTFYVLDAAALAAVPPPLVKTFARYVPERYDDFAWESDRIAHRMFGQGVIKAEGLVSSGVDVWIKRTRRLVINELYRTRDFFNPTNAAQDDYKVGKTRGDGGLGLWQNGKLYVSGNWRNYRVITTGPIRSEFELTYDAWDASGRKVSETKRISIDAGSNMSRVESTFSSDDKSPLQIGVGLAERPGLNVVVPVGTRMLDAWSAINSWRTSTEDGLVVQDQSEGWMTYWQPQDFDKGTTAVAIVLPKGSVETFTNDVPDLPASAFAPPTHTQEEGQPAIRDLLAIAPAEVGKPFVYYLGAGWDRSGDFPTAKAWTDYVRRFAERRDQPLEVSTAN